MNRCQWEECNVPTNNPKYCSLSCGAKYQAKHLRPKRTVEIRQCANSKCETEWPVGRDKRKKYCSRSCSAKTFNEQRGDLTYCVQCNKRLKSGIKYCSPECGVLYRKSDTIQKWLSGEWDATVQSGLAASIRNYLLEQAKYTCTSTTCAVPGGFQEINPVTGKCPLTVNHIDGDSRNNRPENLEVLCPNCHALTPNFGALNKNSTRTYRKKYYRPASEDVV